MRLPTSFRQRLKFNNDCKIWYSDTIYYVSMIHELKIKQEYYLKHNQKLFQRQAETAEFEMVNSYADRINSGVDSCRIKKLFFNRCKPQNNSEEGIIAFKELIEKINNNYSEIIIDINYIKDLFKKFSKYTKDNSNKVFASSIRKEEFLDRVCYTFNNVLKDQYFEKMDRLRMFSTFINYIGNNIKSSPLNELLLNIINYIILLQNGYSIGKYINLFKESLALSYYNDAVADDYLLLIHDSYKELDGIINNSKKKPLVKIDAYSIVKNYVLGQNSSFSKSEVLRTCPSLGSSSVEISLRKLVADGILERLFAGKNTKYRKLKTEN